MSLVPAMPHRIWNIPTFGKRYRALGGPCAFLRASEGFWSMFCRECECRHPVSSSNSICKSPHSSCGHFHPRQMHSLVEIVLAKAHVWIAPCGQLHLARVVFRSIRPHYVRVGEMECAKRTFSADRYADPLHHEGLEPLETIWLRRMPRSRRDCRQSCGKRSPATQEFSSVHS